MVVTSSLGSAAGMVDTPWGSSESLRERKLRPGPGTPPKDVARNQRGRLFGAMVASVSERGYAATRLSDLCEISGVSRVSFYRLFADKEACFVAALEAMIANAFKAIDELVGTREEQVRRGAVVFAELVVAQPAAARMCLIEAYAVGPEGLRPLEEATARLEARAREVAEGAHDQAAPLPEMITAHVGALMEIARERLRLGREAELPGLVDDFADHVLSYPPPPEPLRLATRPPAPAPESLDAFSHAERVLRAFAVVVAEQGYANTTIDLVVKRGSMSPTTFYANFSSKEDALFAAIESAGAQLFAAVLPAFQRIPDWAQAVRGAFGDLFNFLASRPALARLLMVEVYAAGPAALERRNEALRPLELVLAVGRARSPDVPAVASEAISGAIFRLAYRQIQESGTASLPYLAPICTYMTLAPFIGAKGAGAAANGDGSGRRGAPDDGHRLLISKVLGILNKRAVSPRTVSRELEVTIDEARAYIAELERAGLTEVVQGGEDSAERLYRSNTEWISDERWRQMSLAERRAISARITEVIAGEVDQAIELGTFDARIDRHLSRVPLMLDEEGWRKLMAIHLKAFHDSIAVQDESRKRLEKSGKRGIEGTSIQMMFEVPESSLWREFQPPDDDD